MNHSDANRTSYDAPQEEEILRAIQDPNKRIALIQYLESHGLLSDPSHQPA